MGKRKAKVAEMPSPNEINVVDKITFRRWCASMMLNAKQVSLLLRISLPMVYKYLDMDMSANVRPSVALACNLIGEKPASERATWVSTQLKLHGCTDAWPASHPVKDHINN